MTPIEFIVLAAEGMIAAAILVFLQAWPFTIERDDDDTA